MRNELRGYGCLWASEEQ